jgi:uncharacterized protein YecE (DUF72 family)
MGRFRVRVGCSGWQYRHWRGDFYPGDLPQRDWLSFYARHFDTVEINNSFYRLPAEGVFGEWRRRVPARFLFAVKASRYLTHMKKLMQPADAIDRLFARVDELDGNRGPILYQLPRMFHKNADRLEAFLKLLPEPRRIRHAIEFRHESWYAEEVISLLARHNVALCVHDMPGSTTPRITTADFLYLRFHGTSSRYGGSYPRDRLHGYAEWLTECRRPAFVYFNNDAGGHAPRDARALLEMVA